MKKPTYMYLKDVKKSSAAFDATHKVAIYDDSKTSNEIPKWFKKFHEEEFKPLQEAVADLNTKPPKYFLDFQNQVLELFNQLISRIDSLVAKNNLKE